MTWRASNLAALPDTLKVLVVSGEASGDEHTAAVVSALKAKMPNAEIFGMGGSKLRAAGMELIVDSEQSAGIMGISEVLPKLRVILAAFNKLVKTAEERRPNVAVLTDFPDFNLRLAKKLAKRGIPVLYFVSPQLWAWRKGRIKQIKKYVKKVLPIFPFEENFYHAQNMSAEFVGHPFLDRAPIEADKAELKKELGLDPARPVLALLPGSRRAELEAHMEVLAEAFKQLSLNRPGLQAVVPVAPSLSVENLQARYAIPNLKFISGQAREVLHAADTAVVASGTATVEAALSRVPFIVIYRTSALTYAIGKLLIRGVDNIAMPNLILGKRVYPELLQDQCTPRKIVEALEQILGDSALAERMRAAGEEVRRRLARDGNQTSAERTAEIILATASERRKK